MKKNSIALILALSFIALFLCSCSSVSSSPVITYKGISVKEGAFSYSVSQTKTSYILYLTGADTVADIEDIPALWGFAPAEDGLTIGQVVMDEIIASQKMILFFAAYANENNITLTAEEKNKVKSDMDSSIEKNFKSKAVFEEAVKVYGIDYDMLKEYNELQLLAAKARDIYFSEDGTDVITDEDMNKYYEENYYTTQHIFINNKSVSMTDDTPLSEEKAAEKTALAESIMKQIEEGADMDGFLSMTDEELEDVKDQTITFSAYEIGFEEYVNAASSSKTGEIKKIETAGGIYIIKKLDLDKEHFDTYKENIRSLISEERAKKAIAERDSEFIIDKAIVSAHPIDSAPLFK